jgi:hypothetical protein
VANIVKHAHDTHAQLSKVLIIFDTRIRPGTVFDHASLQCSAAPSINKETPFLDQPQAFLGDRLLLQHALHVMKAPMSMNIMS